MLFNADCDQCFRDSLPIFMLQPQTCKVLADNHNQPNLALVGAQVLFKNYNMLRPTYGSCGESLSVV